MIQAIEILSSGSEGTHKKMAETAICLEMSKGRHRMSGGYSALEKGVALRKKQDRLDLREATRMREAVRILPARRPSGCLAPIAGSLLRFVAPGD